MDYLVAQTSEKSGTMRTDLHLLLKSNAELQTYIFWLNFVGESSWHSSTVSFCTTCFNKC